MNIRLSKPASKYLNSCEKNTKQPLKFIPSEAPLEDEIEAIKEARKSIATEGIVSVDDVNWNGYP